MTDWNKQFSEMKKRHDPLGDIEERLKEFSRWHPTLGAQIRQIFTNLSKVDAIQDDLKFKINEGYEIPTAPYSGDPYASCVFYAKFSGPWLRLNWNPEKGLHYFANPKTNLNVDEATQTMLQQALDG